MPEPVRVCLELEPDGDSLTGRARNASGATREFSGWLGLAAAIDAFLPTAAHPDEPEQTPVAVGRDGTSVYLTNTTGDAVARHTDQAAPSQQEETRR